MKQEKGFTLIELVMVMVILGILAAFALLRFADLGSEARKKQYNYYRDLLLRFPNVEAISTLHT